MFSNVEEGAVTKLCMLIKPYFALKGDLIYTTGEIGREIFIIIEGFVSISFNHDVQHGAGDIESTLTKGKGVKREFAQLLYCRRLQL